MDIAQIKEQMKQLREELKAKVKESFASMTKNLFDKYPELNSFGWKEYTDYFNDGETCHFHAHTDHEQVEINGYRYDDEDESPDNLAVQSYEFIYGYNRSTREYEKSPNPRYSPRAKEVVDAVVEFLGAFENEDYEHMFGDHCKVVVTRDAIEIEEYTEHD
jgi:hypothetical protein